MHTAPAGVDGLRHLGLRIYRDTDRRAAHEILRRRLDAEEAPFCAHPGEWDWWVDHADPRIAAPRRLIGDDTLVELTADGHLFAVTPTAADLSRLLSAYRLAPVVAVDRVSVSDHQREAVLIAAGFVPDDDGAEVELVQSLLPLLPDVRLPAGHVVRHVTDEDVVSRADAARLSFGSTLDPDTHRARYRRFMASDSYSCENDLVAVGPTGAVAAFAIVWPDESGHGQFEPVGTHPDHQRRGLGRAVVAAGLNRLRTLGMHTAHVVASEADDAVVSFYRACGFRPGDRVRTWVRPDGRGGAS